MRRVVSCLVSLGCMALHGWGAAGQARGRTAEAPLTSREEAMQMLSRFTFGARPGDLDRVMILGPRRWFAQQLEPLTLADDALARRLAEYPTCSMMPAQALETFPDRNRVTDVADGTLPYPADPLALSVYQVQAAKLQQERDDRLHLMAEPTAAERDAAKEIDQATASRIAGELFGRAKKDRMAALYAMPVLDRIAFATYLSGAVRETLLADMSPRERETFYGMQGGVGTSGRLLDELAQARQLRAVLSERQLQEVMTEFWFNHFNVYAPKDADQWYTAAFERDSIRPHALGSFRDLLLATAASPAMMIYLDNWLSIGPKSIANGVDPARLDSRPGRKGLNENYGREVMELHTLGADGGYTQADVTNLAAMLTGWSVDRPNRGGAFLFEPKKHEPGTIQWFGYAIDEEGDILARPAYDSIQLSAAALRSIHEKRLPAGMKQGVAALCLLAASPRTAHFLSYLLAQRFVADQPPPALVDRLSRTYLASDGDIKAVLVALVGSAEFSSRRYFRNKIKTPQEFVASAFRATATEPEDPAAIVNLLSHQLGEPPYRKAEPAGYYVTAEHWMNTQALLARLNFADQLTHGRFGHQSFDSARVLAYGLMSDQAGAARSGPANRHRVVAIQAVGASASGALPDLEGQATALRILEGTLLAGQVSSRTDASIRAQLAGAQTGAQTGTQPGAQTGALARTQPVAQTGPQRQEEPGARPQRTAAASPANPRITLNLLITLLLGSPEFQAR